MPLIKKISEDEISEIEDYKTLRELKSHQDYIIAESPKVFFNLLRWDVLFHEILISDRFYEENKDLLNSLDTTLLIASHKILSNFLGYKLHHGVFCKIERPKFKKLNELNEKICVLNGITSPENVGVIMRTCAAFKIKSIIIDNKTCSPFVRRAFRVGIGNSLNLLIHKSSDLTYSLEELKKYHYKIYSTANEKNATSLKNFVPDKKFVFIIGSEGHGVGEDVKRASDNILKIDINSEVEHLNAATSCAIVAYQLTL